MNTCYIPEEYNRDVLLTFEGEMKTLSYDSGITYCPNIPNLTSTIGIYNDENEIVEVELKEEDYDEFMELFESVLESGGSISDIIEFFEDREEDGPDLDFNII
jgi:hypothetical protein